MGLASAAGSDANHGLILLSRVLGGAAGRGVYLHHDQSVVILCHTAGAFVPVSAVVCASGVARGVDALLPPLPVAGGGSLPRMAVGLY